MWSLDVLRDLFRHMEWADEVVWRVADTLDGPADDRLRHLLLHIHVVQRAFLSVWTGKPLAFPEPGEFPSLPSLRAWSLPCYHDLGDFITSLSPERLSDEVRLPWAAALAARGMPFVPTLGETMFQVTSHSTYHRGQVNARLRELGAEPPLVDYIAWIWLGRPAHNKSASSGV
jgi:uncharacterized damage-inducible protein DinB